MQGAHGELGVGVVDQHRKLDFRRRDGADVDALLGQRLEGAGGDAGMGAHADADRRNLHHILRPLQLDVADLRSSLLEDAHRALILDRRHGEGDVGRRRVVGDDLDDHVDVDVGVGERHEDRRGDPGLVRDITQRDLRLVAREGDAGDNLLLHDFLLVADKRAKLRVRRIVERRAHVKPDLVHHRQFDRAHLQHLGAERSHFQHFLERHFGEPARLRHHARVGRVDAVDVGVDIASIGRDRRRKRNRGRIRAAAPQRRHPVGGFMHALETGDDGDLARRKPLAEPRPVDARDAGRAMHVVGDKRDLPPRPRARLEPHVLEHQRQQSSRHQFARGDDEIIFGVVEVRARFLAPGDKLVGLTRHRRNDDRDLGAGVDLPFHMRGDVADAWNVGDRRAAEFHHQTRHDP